MVPCRSHWSLIVINHSELWKRGNERERRKEPNAQRGFRGVQPPFQGELSREKGGKQECPSLPRWAWTDCHEEVVCASWYLAWFPLGYS